MVDQRLFHNALYVEDGYPHRLTAGQRRYFYAKSFEFAQRADCTAGVSLRFSTDALKLEFSYEVVSYCRSTNVVDVLENGIHTGSIRLPDMQSPWVFSFQRKTVGPGEIELVLPNTCGMRITDVSFGAWTPVPKRRKKLLLIGDSILQGIHSYFPTCSLSGILAQELEMETINQSVGGARIFPEQLEELSFCPDLIFVSIGINDVPTLTEEPLEERAQAYFQKLRKLYPRQKIATVTPIWNTRMRDVQGYQQHTDHVRRLIRENCAVQNIQVIEGDGLVPHVEKFFNEDGLHPNDLGFLTYGHRVMHQLNR